MKKADVIRRQAVEGRGQRQLNAIGIGAFAQQRTLPPHFPVGGPFNRKQNQPYKKMRVCLHCYRGGLFPAMNGG